MTGLAVPIIVCFRLSPKLIYSDVSHIVVANTNVNENPICSIHQLIIAVVSIGKRFSLFKQLLV